MVSPVEVTSSKFFDKLKFFNNYANECIRFKYIFDETDLKDDKERVLNENSKILNVNGMECNGTKDALAKNGVNGANACESRSKQPFKPEYSHQIFGDDENIFGYRGLRVDYYLTPGLLDAYIGLSYKEKLSASKYDGIEADDVFEAFKKFGCSPGFTQSLDVFCTDKLKKDLEFKPFGHKIHEYRLDNDQAVYEVYKIDGQRDGLTSDTKFLDYIDRVQTMLAFYIETSNFIDTEDEQWSHYLLYEKQKNGSNQRYITCGYVSVYGYYGYPDKRRIRVSQMLVFPTYQHMGHGSRLLEAVYMDACQMPDIIEVTAESPSDEFIHLRDYVTSKMCATLDSFKSSEKLKKGYSQEMYKEALEKFKLSKLQSRRCYEILRLAVTNANQCDEWRDYRLDIKKRFYLPFIRRIKYARNSAAASSSASLNGTNGPASSSAAAAGSSSSSSSTAKPSMDPLAGRMNGKSVRFDSSSNEQEVETTIGFGSSSSKQPSNVESVSIGFGKAAIKQPLSNGKSVSFSSSMPLTKKPKLTSMNTSNSTTEDDDDDEDDDDSNASSNNGEPEPDMAQLLISPEERKKYLEDQFQQSIVDYRKTLKRLENSNCL